MIPPNQKKDTAKTIAADIPFLHRGEEGEAESLEALCLL